VIRRCVVTGATKGIGASICEKLKNDGFEVVGLARTKPVDWQGQFIEADLSKSAGIDAACKQVADLGTIWALINNAGIGIADPIESLDYDDMVRVFTVNTFAPALLTRAAVPGMREGGRIVNLCTSAMLGKSERTTYGGSKAAVASFTRSWALELASRSISVNAISPGPIETELFRSRNPVGSPGELEQLATIPLQRIGTPSEIALVVALLVNPDMAYCTGQVFNIDGGISIGRI
jgi:3-oxoacyl-[acyl-carrier protein] reductase